MKIKSNSENLESTLKLLETFNKAMLKSEIRALKYAIKIVKQVE